MQSSSNSQIQSPNNNKQSNNESIISQEIILNNNESANSIGIDSLDLLFTNNDTVSKRQRSFVKPIIIESKDVNNINNTIKTISELNKQEIEKEKLKELKRKEKEKKINAIRINQYELKNNNNMTDDNAIDEVKPKQKSSLINNGRRLRPFVAI